MSVLIAHPAMNQNVRQLVKASLQARGPAVFHTGIDTTLMQKMVISPRLSDRLSRRSLPPAEHQHTVHHPLWWAHDQWSRRNGRTLHESYESFASLVARRTSSLEYRSVVAYEDAALEIFRSRGQACAIYDLPIPHWRLKHELLLEESQRSPDWAATLGGLDDDARILTRKDSELFEADVVISASPLTTRSVRLVRPDASVVEIPYGCAAPRPGPRVRRSSEPLRVLFVGELSQRKGISYVFEAMRRLGSWASLTVVGRKPQNVASPLTTALSEANYIPSLSGYQVSALMRDSDVLLLPSIVEGFGLVICEALSAGIPVITTDRTGGAHLFARDHPDWLVPAGSSDGIVSALEKFLGPGDLLSDAKHDAVSIASSNSWDVYRGRVGEVLDENAAG